MKRFAAAISAAIASYETELPAVWQRLLTILPIYLVVYTTCFIAATLLRFDFSLSAEEYSRLLSSLPLVLTIKGLVLLQTREWQRKHRYTSMSDAMPMAVGAVVVCVLLWTTNFFVSRQMMIPRSIILIDGSLSVLTIGGLRTLFRMLNGNRRWGMPAQRRRTLIYGADPGAVSILRTLHETESGFRVVGFYSTEPHTNQMIGGVKVYGQPKSLARVARRLHVREVLLPSSLSGHEVRAVIQQCGEAQLTAHVIPSVGEIVEGRYKLGIRQVTISDLLRREPNQLDIHGIRGYITGRRVMVTGGAGSIGSEVCRQILELGPASLVIVDQSECSIFGIEQEFSGRSALTIQPAYVIADITDQANMSQIFSEHRPELVFHAAAYKHVPLMEHNPREAVRNNILGTRNIVDLASEYEVERFVLISTDKAVRPTSLMGASKLMAEKYLQAMAARSNTRFITVRFGNVLNSAGSVVPTFRRQIESGGPITVTHPDIERFFMTIPEAVQLVLQAGAIGETGDVLILDMGQPVKIVDLARDLIMLSGLQYPDDIDIVFTGLRPGEKLYEELFYDHERSAERVHEKIFRGQSPAVPYPTIAAQLARLKAALSYPNAQMHQMLMDLARSYAEAEAGVVEETIDIRRAA